MRKRIIALCASVICVLIALPGCGERYVGAERLPERAKELLSRFYPEETVVSVEKEGWLKGYEVILKNGTELSFRRNGELASAEAARDRMLPWTLVEEVLPQAACSYIEQNYHDSGVKSVDADRRRYEVAVAIQGMELVFDRNGKYLGADK